MGFLGPEYLGTKQGRRQDLCSVEGNFGQNFIHEFLSSPVLLGVAKITVLGDIQQKCTHQRLLKNFEKFKNFSKNFQK